MSQDEWNNAFWDFESAIFRFDARVENSRWLCVDTAGRARSGTSTARYWYARCCRWTRSFTTSIQWTSSPRTSSHDCIKFRPCHVTDVSPTSRTSYSDGLSSVSPSCQSIQVVVVREPPQYDVVCGVKVDYILHLFLPFKRYLNS